MRVEIIKDCMDLMGGFELLQTFKRKPVLLTVIDTLGSYPKPQRKGDTVRASDKDLGAYLSVSNVRNACKLADLDFIGMPHALSLIRYNLEQALTILQE
ncbi:MAG: hypothetical protein WCY89_01200 [Flavobacteriaceae bacterium]